MEWISIISGGATGIVLCAFYEIAYRRRARLEKEATEEKEMAARILSSVRNQLKATAREQQKVLFELIAMGAGKASERAFKEGDVVRLKSGGPAMTIESIAPEGGSVCVWFLGKESLRGPFSKTSLKHEPSAPPRYGEGNGVENI